MSRLVYSVMVAFSLSVLSIAAVGCGSSGNTVIEDTRSAAEVDQANEEYDQLMLEEQSEELQE